MELIEVLLISLAPALVAGGIHAYKQPGDWHPFFAVMFAGVIFGVSFAITSGVLYWVE